MLGDSPFSVFRSKLLVELVAHRLFAFDSIRFFQSRDVEPAHLVFAAGDDRSAVGDQAVDERDVGSGLLAFDDVRTRRVGGHEDVGFHAGKRGVCCQGSGGIACGRHRELSHTEFLRHRDRRRHPASLERLRRILAFVFDVEVEFDRQSRGEAVGLEQRRHTFAEGDDVRFVDDGKNFAVSPQGRFPRRQ